MRCSYTCEQINDCVLDDGTSPCAHGNCVDGILEFKCVCQDGYSGSLCQVSELDVCEVSELGVCQVSELGVCVR